LDGHDSWSFTLREECTLQVFENRKLRRTFGPKGEEETGGCIEFHNKEIHNLFSLQSIIIKVK
jgi:hypothetical protein